MAAMAQLDTGGMTDIVAIIDKATALKKTANAAFREERFAAALAAYSEALALLPADDAVLASACTTLRSVLLSNRAAAYLGRLDAGDAARAEADAARCTRVRPRWWKGYWRRARALAALKRLPEAQDVLAALVARAERWAQSYPAQGAGAPAGPDEEGLDPAMTGAQIKTVAVKGLIWALVLVDSVDAVEGVWKELMRACGNVEEGVKAESEALAMGEDGHGHGCFRAWQARNGAQKRAAVAEILALPDRDDKIRALPPDSKDPGWGTSWSQQGGQFFLIVCGKITSFMLAVEVVDHKPNADDIVNAVYAALLAPGGSAEGGTSARTPGWPLQLMIAHRMAGEYEAVRARLAAVLPSTMIHLQSREGARASAERHGNDPDGYNDKGFENPQQNF